MPIEQSDDKGYDFKRDVIRNGKKIGTLTFRDGDYVAKQKDAGVSLPHRPDIIDLNPKNPNYNLKISKTSSTDPTKLLDMFAPKADENNIVCRHLAWLEHLDPGGQLQKKIVELWFRGGG